MWESIGRILGRCAGVVSSIAGLDILLFSWKWNGLRLMGFGMMWWRVGCWGLRVHGWPGGGGEFAGSSRFDYLQE